VKEIINCHSKAGVTVQDLEVALCLFEFHTYVGIYFPGFRFTARNESDIKSNILTKVGLQMGL